MHKKLAADLTSLAHSILQMKNKEDVFALQQKAHELYEKLSVLAYVEEYINHTPKPIKSKEEMIAEIEAIEEQKTEVKEEIWIDEIKEGATVEKEVEDTKEELIAKEVELEVHSAENSDLLNVVEKTLEKDSDEQVEDEVNEEIKVEVGSLEDELKGTIAVDVAADLFEVAPKKSLNDKLQGDIQIGLNDRIAFVKNLFDGSQEDFNRVVSQLNTFKTLKEAKKFINKMVKSDYDWKDKEGIEERFMSIVERKFT